MFRYQHNVHLMQRREIPVPHNTYDVTCQRK